MMRIKVIAFFLSLLIMMQMVPVAVIGQALSQNRWTEELPHNDSQGKADISVNFNHPYLPPLSANTPHSFYAESVALAYIQISDQIPSNHSTEVVSPPPDVCPI